MGEEIVEYVKGELAKGFTEDQVKAAMKEQGWADADIEKHMQQAKAEIAGTAQPAQPAAQPLVQPAAQPAPAAEQPAVQPAEAAPAEQPPAEEKKGLQAAVDKIKPVVIQNKWIFMGAGAFLFLLIMVIVIFAGCGGEEDELPTTRVEPPETGPGEGEEKPPVEQPAPAYNSPKEVIESYVEAYKSCNLDGVGKFYKEGEGPLKEGQNALGWQIECRSLTSGLSKADVVEEKKTGEKTADVSVEFCIGEGDKQSCNIGVFNVEEVDGSWMMTTSGGAEEEAPPDEGPPAEGAGEEAGNESAPPGEPAPAANETGEEGGAEEVGEGGNESGLPENLTFGGLFS